MAKPEVKTSYESLRARVSAVAALHYRCAVAEGGGRFVWVLGGALLAALLLDVYVGLPLLLRAPVLPALAFAAGWLAWRKLRPAVFQRYSTRRKAMLVETARPDLATRVVSALQLYPELEKDHTPFDTAMLEGLVLYAQRTTEAEDFRQVIDRAPARRAAVAATCTVLIWVGAFALNSGGILAAFGRLGSAWGEIRDVALKAGGARIVIEDLDKPAYLRGSDVTIRAAQQGFRNDEMALFIRPEGETEWQEHRLEVDESGRGEHIARSVQQTFECYCAAGRMASKRATVIVTERPRIVKLTVEYDLPAYVRRAPVVQPRSDGHLKALYGSSVLLTLEANKPLKTARLRTSFPRRGESMSVGGQFAQAAIQLEDKAWLADERPVINETYSLKLTDEYGFTNEDADSLYQLQITRDREPVIGFVGLPHRSSADEPHITDKDLGQLSITVRATDDYGISRITLGYRIEDLETGEVKTKGEKPVAFGLPRAQVSRLRLARVTDLDLQVGERLVFWAEAQDAYDLEPETGPHKVRTPPFRIAAVTEEQLFAEVRYSDEWSAQWYDSLKIASLARRAPPPRMSPEWEPAGKVAEKLLDAVPLSEGFLGDDAQAIRNYFESLAGVQ